MANFFDDNDDMRFYINHAIHWAPLVELTEFHYKTPDAHANVGEALEFYNSVLELAGDFSANAVAPHAATIDREHATLVDSEVTFPAQLQSIFDQVNELQMHGMCLPRELGGMNCPYILFLFTTELFARADVSVAAHVGFHGGMALAGLMFSIMEGSTTFDLEKAQITETRFADMVAEISAGQAWGSMDITEPGAGSDMGALSTHGVQDADGNWLVTGNKIFITSGHAKYHYVIARTEDNAKDPLDGLSMFLVKAFEDLPSGERVRYAWFDKLEEKLGHHGSATVAVRYEKSPAQLIGKRGDGFKMMLLLMNNARLGVGFESIGISEAAYRMAKEYAEGRPSMGKTIDRHEMIADFLEEMRTDIQALRAIAVQGAFHEEMSQKIRLAAQVQPDANARNIESNPEFLAHRAKARRLTPLVKYMGSEKAVEHARRCIQIHGGYGYINEYGAEKLLRDAMVLPIYEGTSQIQSLMAMKDAMGGILKAPGKFFSGMAGATWRACFATDRPTRRVARLQRRQYAVLFYLLRKLAMKKLQGGLADFKKPWDPKKDFALAMLHAERLIAILIDVACAEVLLKQAQQFPERAELLDRFLVRAEPRCRAMHYVITQTGHELLGRLEREDAAASA